MNPNLKGGDFIELLLVLVGTETAIEGSDNRRLSAN